ncbi:MAG: LacI family transcriptional regulator [Candidatus Accumulibacter sp.]|nr:LacI family transcriptional regulator [Accumulibacter sp.]
MATIQDVASRSGVSVTTVSNLLNGRTNRMSQATLEKVRSTIAELNYRPSHAARQLKTGRIPVLGLLVPSIVNPMFAFFAREIEIVARKKYGYRIFLGNTYRQKTEETIFLEDLLSHGVRGAIVVSSLADQSHFRDAIERGLNIVNYDCRSTGDDAAKIGADNVSMDNHWAGRIAAQSLIDAGCRRLAFATASGRTTSRRDKIAGFLAAARDAGLAKEARVIEGKAQSAYGDTELTELGKNLAREIATTPGGRPDGVVAVNDMLAIGMIAGFREHDVRVPDDISLAGIDDMAFSSLVSPAITTVRPPVGEMAELAVHRLMARMEDPKLPAKDFLFTPTLVRRQSVAGVGG